MLFVVSFFVLAVRFGAKSKEQIAKSVFAIDA